MSLKYGALKPVGVFSFFEHFHFWALGTQSWTLNRLKTFGAL